jgi:integrase
MSLVRNRLRIWGSGVQVRCANLAKFSGPEIRSRSPPGHHRQTILAIEIGLRRGDDAFRLAWERVRRRADLQDLHFHDLRHEALSRFFEMGLTTPEVASISGHRDLRMLFRDSHPMRQRVLEVINRASL